tara:strand:- start:181 stop:2148 length:1968 start_codon:yes stop_codon:yes gene_type:complete
MTKPASQTEKGQNLKDTPKEEKAVASAGHAAAVAAAKKERSLPDPCGKSEMGKINIALHNFMTALKGIKQYGELYVMGSINKLQNLTSLIRQTSTIIGAVMKTLISRLRDFLIDKIHSAISALIDKLLPQIAKAIKNTVIQVIVDNIFCAFKDIVKNLVNLAVDFLKQMVEKVINVPFCAAQQFTNAFVNNIAALVDNAVGPILDQINDVLGGVGKVVGSVFQALDYILGFESFLCAAPNCPEITKFKASPWAGPTKAQVDAFDDFLAPLGGKQTPDADSLIRDATKFIDGIEIFGDKLGDSAGAAGYSLNTACKELTKASQCGPPKVEIFGGGGAGAVGELVLDEIGLTVGVNLLDRGKGYIRPPFVSFVDSCEDSFLSGYATITTDGHIDRITIRNPVIVPREDGRDEFDPPPGGGDPPDPGTGPTTGTFTGNITAGTNIITNVSDTSDLSPGTNITLIGGGGNVTIDGSCTISSIVGDTLTIDCDFGGFGSAIGASFNANNIRGGYGRDYVVCLYGFEVLDTGIGYTINDSIIITPDIPNLSASVQITEYGQIIAVNIGDPICGIPGYPEPEIISETGYGCILRPILEFIRIEEFEEDSNDTGINIDTDSIIDAELSNSNREGLITTLRGRKLLTDGELNRKDVIRIVDCIS